MAKVGQHHDALDVTYAHMRKSVFYPHTSPLTFRYAVLTGYFQKSLRSNKKVDLPLAHILDIFLAAARFVFAIRFGEQLAARRVQKCRRHRLLRTSDRSELIIARETRQECRSIPLSDALLPFAAKAISSRGRHGNST